MSRSYKKSPIFKSKRRGMKKKVRKQTKRRLKEEIKNGAYYRKFGNKYDYIKQYSRMSEKDFLKKKKEYEKNKRHFFNDFYSSLENFEKAYKRK